MDQELVSKIGQWSTEIRRAWDKIGTRCQLIKKMRDELKMLTIEDFAVIFDVYPAPIISWLMIGECEQHLIDELDAGTINVETVMMLLRTQRRVTKNRKLHLLCEQTIGITNSYASCTAIVTQELIFVVQDAHEAATLVEAFKRSDCGIKPLQLVANPTSTHPIVSKTYSNTEKFHKSPSDFLNRN